MVSDDFAAGYREALQRIRRAIVGDVPSLGSPPPELGGEVHDVSIAIQRWNRKDTDRAYLTAAIEIVYRSRGLLFIPPPQGATPQQIVQAAADQIINEETTMETKTVTSRDAFPTPDAALDYARAALDRAGEGGVTVQILAGSSHWPDPARRYRVVASYQESAQ